MNKIKNNNSLNKVAFVSFFYLAIAVGYSIYVKPIYAQCTNSGGTISSSCSWTNTLGTEKDTGNDIRGVMDLSGNIGSITVGDGATVTIRATDTIVLNEINMSGSSGSIVIIDGGTIKPGSNIWYTSTSCDGSTAVVSRTQPENYGTACGSCSAGTWSCSGTCRKKRRRAGCYDVWEYGNVTNGNICSDGTEVAGECSTPGSWACDGSCRRVRALYFCQSGTCSAYTQYSNVTQNKICEGDVETTGYCSYGPYSCATACVRQRTVYRCNGSNSCSYAAGVQNANISSNRVCSNGSEAVGSCATGSWGCSNICTRFRPSYNCNGAGSCSNQSGGTIDYCLSGAVCSSGSCVWGDCGLLGESCSNGSCTSSNSCASYGGFCTTFLSCASCEGNCTLLVTECADCCCVGSQCM